MDLEQGIRHAAGGPAGAPTSPAHTGAGAAAGRGQRGPDPTGRPAGRGTPAR